MAYRAVGRAIAVHRQHRCAGEGLGAGSLEKNFDPVPDDTVAYRGILRHRYVGKAVAVKVGQHHVSCLRRAAGESERAKERECAVAIPGCDFAEVLPEAVVETNEHEVELSVLVEIRAPERAIASVAPRIRCRRDRVAERAGAVAGEDGEKLAVLRAATPGQYGQVHLAVGGEVAKDAAAIRRAPIAAEVPRERRIAPRDVEGPRCIAEQDRHGAAGVVFALGPVGEVEEAVSVEIGHHGSDPLHEIRICARRRLRRRSHPVAQVKPAGSVTHVQPHRDRAFPEPTRLRGNEHHIGLAVAVQVKRDIFGPQVSSRWRIETREVLIRRHGEGAVALPLHEHHASASADRRRRRIALVAGGHDIELAVAIEVGQIQAQRPQARTEARDGAERAVTVVEQDADRG